MNERETTIRPLRDVAEMRVCVALQRIVWGYTELETVPDHIFVVAAKTGGQVVAAFDADMPVGFVLAFPALRKGQAYLHSHLLAVLPEYQNRGVGRRLKLAQRDEALARGIDLIEWTFDPLQLKNAYFNIAKLGAIVRRYIPDLYGRTSSPLHGGLPTDRLVAEWRLRSPRVQSRLSGKPGAESKSREQIAVPASIQDLCRADPEKAEQIQLQLRRDFERLIAEGRAAVGFRLDQKQGVYLLEPYED
jgi:predicted GNAT superfamily acetyltransferase